MGAGDASRSRDAASRTSWATRARHGSSVRSAKPKRRPSKAIAALDIKPGQVIADIGAGSGYYTVRLADASVPTGRVFATDIQPEMLALIKKKIDARAASNITLVLGTPIETRLPDGAIDLAIMVDVYHELEQPQTFLQPSGVPSSPVGGSS